MSSNGVMTQDAARLHTALQKLTSEKTLKESMVGKNVAVQKTDAKAIQLPEGMSFDEGIEWLQRRKQSDEQFVSVVESIQGFAADGLAAFHRVLGRIYGWVEAVPTGFFGSTPPQMVSIQLAPGKSISLPFGRIVIPGIEGHVDLQLGQGKLAIVAMIKGKHREAVTQLVELTRESSKLESIYKGQAIKTAMNSATAPEFVRLDGIKGEDLILSRDVEAAIKTSLFTPIQHADQCRKFGIPLKRGILLNGPFGTGKSFSAMVAALEAKKNGWTFIYLDDIEKLSDAVEMARHYAPSVLFAEDLDRVVHGERNIDMDTILNTLDGIDGKGSEVIAVFTTNDIEAINPAMLRPGRLDAVIDIKAPDAEAAERLLRNYSRGLAEEDCNFADAAELVAGMVPAAIREVVERAKLAAIWNKHDQIQGSDLQDAALAMRNQTQLFTRAQPVKQNAELLNGIDRLLVGVDVLQKIHDGHVDDWQDTADGCGNPNCPIHGNNALK